MDAAGRLWLLGRCNGKIQDARGTLYPFAVECAAMQTPAIRRAALAAIDGCRVLAVESRENVSLGDILRTPSWAAPDPRGRLVHNPPAQPPHPQRPYDALAHHL